MGMDTTLQLQIADQLEARNLFLVTAESCTGGLLGHLITNLAGSSAFYLGGLVAYANLAKMRWLGVKRKTLVETGAVSRETVLEMARGVRHAFAGEVDETKIVSLSISGIAGPDGGTEEKPVGTVWIGLSSPWGDEAKPFHFEGDRLAIKAQAAEQALELLLNSLKNHFQV